MNRDETYQNVCLNPNRHPGITPNNQPKEASIVAQHIPPKTPNKTYGLENGLSMFLRMATSASSRTCAEIWVN